MNSFCVSKQTSIQQRNVDREFSAKHKTNGREEQVEYEYVVEGTSLKMKGKLILLNSLHQDLFDWVKDFRTAAERSFWDGDTSLRVLKSVISPDILELLGDKRTGETILLTLLKLKYPARDAYFYQAKLAKTLQSQFIFVYDYYNAIQELVKRIGIALNLTQNEERQRINESFMLGLHPSCKLKFAEADVFSAEEILVRIKSIEDTILEVGDKVSRHEKFENSEKKEIRNNQRFKCRVHKTNTHSDEQCFVQKGNVKHQSNQKDGLKIIKEEDSDLRSTSFNCFLNNKTASIKAIIDTGSTKSYISKEVAEKSLLNKLGGERIKITLANSSEEICDSYVIVHIRPVESSINYKIKCYILNRLSAELILVNDFLSLNKCIIDYNRNILTTSKEIIKLTDSDYNFSFNLPDKDLVEISNLFHASDNKNQNLVEIINDYKQRCKNEPIPGYEFSIPTKEIKIVRSQAYPLSLKYEDKFKEEIKRLTEAGVLRKSNSTFSSPVFVSEKPNGDLRILCDFRNLNAISEPLDEVFPGVQDEFHKFKDKRIFSTFDMRSGYYQVKIKESDIHKTAIITRFGKYEYCRLAFGLMNAPKFFHSMMRDILEGIEGVSVYVDDIILASNNEENHLELLKRVFQILIKNNINLNIEKCQFMQNEVRFLGNIVNQHGISIDQSRVKNFHLWPEPNTKKKLQRLLGTINWYRQYLPNLSIKLDKLYEKLKTKEKFIKLNSEEINTIRKIYCEIKNAATLAHPDLNKSFILHTDASDIGASGILTQSNKIIGYYSFKFNTTHKNYTTMEKELFAIVMSLKHFRKIILGGHILIMTDNKNLTFSKINFNARVSRWYMLLNEYRMEFKYLPGKENIGADFLSREQILIIKNADSGQSIEKKDSLKNFIHHFHGENCHPGINNTYSTLRRFIKTKKLHQIIKEVVRNCKECQINKFTNWKYGLTKNSLISKNKLEDTCTDICGPFSTEDYKTDFETEKFYIISFTDRCSRYTKIVPIDNLTGKTTVKAFKNAWIKQIGKPKTILSDQGRNYKSTLLKKFCEKNEIKHIFSSAYSPTGNSLAERIMSHINLGMRIYFGKNLKETIRKVENRINNLVNRNLGCCPVEKITGKHPFNINNETYDFEKINLKEKQTKIKRNVFHTYKVKDLIYLKNLKVGKGKSIWTGPFEIQEVKQDKNKVLVKVKDKYVWANLWNVKPVGEGVNVVKSQHNSNLLSVNNCLINFYLLKNYTPSKDGRKERFNK